VALAQVDGTVSTDSITQTTDQSASSDTRVLDTTLPGTASDSPADSTDTLTTPPTSDSDSGETIPPDGIDQSTLPEDATPSSLKGGQMQPMAMGAGSGNISPTIPAPNVLSIQNAQPKVDGTSGALNFRIPLDIPPGRNGLQPDLALVYNSQNTQDGIAGYGWEISIPYISRLNKTGSNNLYNAAYFTSSLDGELATSSAGVYRGRVDESRRTYSFSSNTWTVYDKNGTRYLFGSASQSQLAATTSPSNVYRWMLDEIRDTNDNYVKFTYTRDGNQLYPDTITYTGHGVSDGIFTVVFTKSSRPDPYIDYRPGFRVTTSYRITQITANLNGSMVRQYALGYTSGNNGVRSLLNSIQQSGNGDSGTTTLPPLTLSYISTTTQFATPGGLIGPAWIAADINGDGVNDNNVFFLDGTPATSSLVNGTANYVPEYWATYGGSPDTHPPLERGTRFLDINADGKADIVRGYFNYSTGASSSAIWLSRYITGCGTWSSCYAWYSDYAWLSTTTGTPTVPQIDYDGTGSIHHLSTGVFADVNSDGLPDFLQRVDGYYSADTHLGTGSGWVATTSVFQAPTTFPLPFTPTGTNLQFADINGDGLVDAISSNGTVTSVSLNNGTGWGDAEPQWTISTTTLFSSGGTYYDRGIRFFDINGDGLLDMVHSFSGSGSAPELATYSQVFLNTGSGWATSTTYTLPATIITSTSPGIWSYNEYANWIGNGQMAQDVLSTITYPKGGSSTISYANSTQTGQNPQLPYELLVVSSVVNHDGFSSNEETDYAYGGALQYYPASNLPDRKFAGFATSTETRSGRVVTTYFNQRDATSTAIGEQSDGYAQMNHPFRVDIKTPGGLLMQQTFTRWDAIPHGNVAFLAAGRQVVQTYASDGSHRDTATEYQYSTSTDDLLETDQYGEVTGNSDGTFTDIGTDGRLARFVYASATSTNLTVPIEKMTGSMLSVSTTSTPGTSASVQALVVAGGGGGGAGFNTARGGGGGGAGGVLYDSAHTVSAASYSITVGTGGSGSTNSNFSGNNGNNSIFDSLTAIGGGGGGSDWQGPSTGGSGGGDDAAQHGGAAGTTGQGTTGGSKGSGDSGAGGGGANQAGQVTTNGNGGAGGAGYTSSISGSTTTYAGGGGGGASAVSGGGAGGAGGGGSGGWASGSSPTNRGTAGTANTGGGGGGGKGSGNGNTGNGGDGGSGVVVIAAPIGVITSASGGTHTTSGGNDIWTFTSSGTWTVSSIASTISTSTIPMATSSDTKYYYDNLSFGSVSSGNQTRQENWKSGSIYASSTAGYDSYGLVASSTDRNGKTTMYGYDAYNLYPASTTDALGHNTQQTFNYSSGQVTQTTEPNVRLTKKLYDGVGRVIEQQQSDLATPASLVTASTFTYTDNSSPPSIVKRSDYLTATTTVDSYTFTDGLGREIQKRAQNNAGSYTAIDKTYDSTGQLHSSSCPISLPARRTLRRRLPRHFSRHSPTTPSGARHQPPTPSVRRQMHTANGRPP
jgi:hypothetical protein